MTDSPQGKQNVRSFVEAAADPVGTIYIDRWDEGVRFVVLRGPSALCAYIGVPVGHPLAGHSYNDLPVNAHGGLTYAGSGVTGLEDAGLYWYGWDYGHAGDRLLFSLDSRFSTLHMGDEEWTPSAVDSDSWEVLYDFHGLMRLAESIATRSGAALRAFDHQAIPDKEDSDDRR